MLAVRAQRQCPRRLSKYRRIFWHCSAQTLRSLCRNHRCDEQRQFTVGGYTAEVLGAVVGVAHVGRGQRLWPRIRSRERQ